MQSEALMHMPLLHKAVFDIPPGWKVRVITLDGLDMIGDVFVNPKETGMKDCLQVINCCKTSNPNRIFAHLQRIFSREVVEITEVSRPPPKEKLPPALQMNEFVVKNLRQLNRVIEVMLQHEVVGIAFHGELLSRFEAVGWVAFNCAYNLIVIDIVTLTSSCESSTVWSLLKVLLEKKSVMKIAHNLRIINEYLNRRHSIVLKNGLDIEVLDLYVQHQTIKKTSDDENKPADKLGFRHLHSLFQEYLSHKVICKEIRLMRTFELTSKSNQKMMNRPSISHQDAKGIAISVKYLPDLKNILIESLHGHYQECVNLTMSHTRDSRMVDIVYDLNHPETMDKGTWEKMLEPWAPVLNQSGSVNEAKASNDSS